MKKLFALLFVLTCSVHATYLDQLQIWNATSGNVAPVDAVNGLYVLSHPTGTQTVSGTITLSGTSTVTASGPLAVTGTFWQTTQPVSGTFFQATQPVSGTFWQSTQPISAASLPLPTGASTAAKQPALGTAGSASADVLSVQGIASMTPLKVDGSAVVQPISGNIGLTGAPAVTISSGTLTLSGTLPAFGSTPLVNIGTLASSIALTAGSNQTVTVANPITTLTLSGTLPAYAVTPLFNVGTFANSIALTAGSNQTVTVANPITTLTLSGTLPAFGSTPTFNLGTLNGASTAANQSTGITALNQIHTDLIAALPTGSNLIGAVTISGSVSSVLSAFPPSGSRAVGGTGVTLTTSPTVTTSAYTSTFVIAGVQTLSGAVSTQASGVINSVMIDMKGSVQTGQVDVIFFNANPTNSTFTDHAAIATNSADAFKIIGIAHLIDWVTTGAGSTAQALNLNIAFKVPNGTALYAVPVARATLNAFGSTSDLQLGVNLSVD